MKRTKYPWPYWIYFIFSLLKIKSFGIQQKLENLYKQNLFLSVDHVLLNISYENLGVLFRIYLFMAGISLLLLILEKLKFA